MKYLDALLKALICVLLCLIWIRLGVMCNARKEGFADVHLVRHDLGKIANRLDPGIIRFKVEGREREGDMKVRMNLVEGIQLEIKRCSELLKRYEEIPSGKFAIIMIKKDIADAEKAIAFDDTVEMVRCCKALKRCE